ncbi:MAG: diguanylate cyclase domain-containing protein [Candidatus Dormibacteria bacterium]
MNDARADPDPLEAGSVEELTRPFLEVLRAATGLESVYLTQVHWGAGEQEILHVFNAGALDIPEGLRVEWSDTLCRRALLGGPSRTSNVPGDYSDSQAAAELKLQTYVTCPVVQQDHTIWGTVCGASSAAVEVDEKSMALMKQVAGLIAERIDRERGVKSNERAIERERDGLARANTELQQAAQTDHLTGIHNRRAFEERWRLEIARAQRFQYPVALLLLDVDGFKAVNDTQGHAAGDAVLAGLAGALHKHLRDIDLLARLGGDEFVMGLSHADTLVGEHIFNRVQATVATADFGAFRGPIGISGGIASSATTPAADLLDAADRALYQAKDQGRNRAATWHGELPD